MKNGDATPDPRLILWSGKSFLKSAMSADQWKVFYPVEAVVIDGFRYNLFSKEIGDIAIVQFGQDNSIRLNRASKNFRFFCHHTGRAFMDGDEAQRISTTYGVIYTDMKVIHSFTFPVDGLMEFRSVPFGSDVLM